MPTQPAGAGSLMTRVFAFATSAPDVATLERERDAQALIDNRAGIPSESLAVESKAVVVGKHLKEGWSKQQALRDLAWRLRKGFGADSQQDYARVHSELSPQQIEQDTQAIRESDRRFQQEVLQPDTTVLVKFFAPWCAPCMAVGPSVDEFEKQEKGQVPVVKVNVDGAPDLVASAHLTSVPTLALYQNGTLVASRSGLDDQGKVLQPKDIADFVRHYNVVRPASPTLSAFEQSLIQANDDHEARNAARNDALMMGLG